MTLHTAKGLEFPVVFVTGWEDGTFPHMRSLADPDQLAEERRLAYVGLTRARERLYISRAAVRTAWGVPNEFPASRFLDDLPDEVVDWRRRESSMATLRASGSGWGGGASAWGGRASGRSGVTTRAGSPKPSTGRPTSAPRDDAPSFGAGKVVGPVPDLAIGDKVTHDSYGLGVVVGIEGAGQNAVAKIDFGTDGTKRLLLRYSPVTKL
jgi:DNA helicase-2/ATP-dependent DNA helicase PcrA